MGRWIRKKGLLGNDYKEKSLGVGGKYREGTVAKSDQGEDKEADADIERVMMIDVTESDINQVL